MAKKKEFDLIDNPEAAVEAGLSKVEGFVQNNKEKILYVLGAVIVLIAGTWGYNQFITKPKEEKAQIAIYPAQLAFEKDSLELALNGNGLSIGFLDIIDEYGSTKAANLANYYAGLCYLNLGQPADAIGYLDNFKGSDPVLSVLAKGAIGDAFANLNQPEEASEYYLKAAEKNSNNFLTPIFLKKAGTASEISEDFKTALKVYKRLKLEFSNSDEAQDIDALISFCEAKMNN